MPVQALRSVEDRFDDILRAVNVKRLVREMGMADKAFHFKYFKGYREIGRGRIKKIADKEIFGGGEGHELLANLIIVHWNERHAQLYREMVAHVKTIDEDVEAIERIEDDKASAIVDDLLKRHSLGEILLCVRLNGVRFRPEFVQWRLVDGKEGVPPEGEGEGEAEEAEASADESAEETESSEA